MASAWRNLPLYFQDLPDFLYKVCAVPDLVPDAAVSTDAEASAISPLSPALPTTDCAVLVGDLAVPVSDRSTVRALSTGQMEPTSSDRCSGEQDIEVSSWMLSSKQRIKTTALVFMVCLPL